MTKLVKICGIRTKEAASVAIESGSDLLGIILVPNKKRTIEYTVAKEISELVRSHRKMSVKDILSSVKKRDIKDSNTFFSSVSELVKENGPYLVGVFRNQPVSEVFKIATELRLDFIQLHGDEDKGEFLEYNKELNFGIIPRYVVPRDVDVMRRLFSTLINSNGFAFPLLDSEGGGDGKVIDWGILSDLSFGKFILAGGLAPSNLKETANLENLIGYDVSSGTEDIQGNKDPQKIRDFIKIGKTI
ncbi:uncharacterized protein PRCAT00003142001 [Priceomyces carsonii]|uniref:uncharacterized protein n=1 Tax=Priceomyces carsonii TaxID=28549 RepID=UPI002EDA91D5|nr:unnamed protein product [Priceomyces carsonii]